ncbi:MULTISPECIES: hypothetical protein [unclassified Streptomyces]|uniref:hypothetical protein n=1 Tax=unclassified Streptomyces TaxID=2593676 RepID=UPI00331696B0
MHYVPASAPIPSAAASNRPAVQLTSGSALAHRAYAGHGHTPGESWLVANTRRDIQLNRETAREALRDQSAPYQPAL